MAYTKLHSSIIHSTIWREAAHVRLVWITMLAMADRDGTVEASVPGLADAARVTLRETEDALQVFLSPDPYSRNPANEGRRIETVPGGWRLLNYDEHRHKASREDALEKQRERMRRYREKQAEKDDVTQTRHKKGDVTACDDIAEAEAEAERKEAKASMSGKPDNPPPDTPKNGQEITAAKRVLEFLNERTGKAYRPVDANIRLIRARLREYDEMTLRKVIARKARDWETNDKMAPYLRPATLFCAQKCAQYVGELVVDTED